MHAVTIRSWVAAFAHSHEASYKVKRRKARLFHMLHSLETSPSMEPMVIAHIPRPLRTLSAWFGLNVWETFNEVGLAVKRSTRGSQQPWLSSSPIDRNFYFAGPPSRIDAQTNSAPSAPPFSDAERTWAAIKGTTSHAVLEVFIRRFGDTDFGIMARKRLDELRGDEPGGNVTVEQREPKGRTGEESSTGA